MRIRKPGPLDDAESELMRRHTLIGKLLGEIEAKRPAASGALSRTRPDAYPAHVRNDGGQAPARPTRALAAVATLAPLLAALAFVVFLGTRGADVDAGPVATATAATAVSGGTADPPAGEALAFADQVTDGAAEVEPEPNGAPAGSDPGSSPVDPTSQIVWVRRGESVAVLDAPAGERIAKQGDETEFGSPSVFSVQSWREGWIGVSTPLLANGELGWIRADSRELQAGRVEHAIVVDLSERVARLYEAGDQLRSWVVTVGSESSPTPTGRFAITDTFRGGLNPAYGCCAVVTSATQPNLPADWPGGDRVAFHGTGGLLGVAASLGCLRSEDEVLKVLLETVPLGTPVTIRE